ncbi:tRNA (adenosine(37)-N6)-dimethylallyltransferase MiaA [Halobacillus shinanisalinarum]|uniref:tRNA dimethylallyltransferase n=1 Tax=Halobacillus shinanisalinarum TaxID=2932258 RepID=A0ABY4GYX8_9BACI|nr:tRNA (adenosine(37)-N6)-dimethylallyltransferase MiaA [Halobacillus shinanisalinarum]UOQ93373.1 tRNA (adenosine(37)-N6)-dimethylallyltransferase MiaA [Halobacillus shinanisalinarum]
MKPKVISIVGPTAVGKSKLGVETAKRFNGEVISGDSMQIYRDMNIGTAKVTTNEMEGVVHHMIDVKDAGQSFSVAEFQKKVQSLIVAIYERGKVPVLVGGTGLYIQATLFDYNFSSEEKDERIMKGLEQQAREQGIQAMYDRLVRIDPVQAEKIHPNNERRVLRALEVYESTGQTMSEYQSLQSSVSPFQPIFIGLEMDRELLYIRINSRVDQMIEDGLVSEVRSLYERGLEGYQSMSAIGYKEFIPYFKGEYELDRAVELLKRNSRRYAKRQYTYFKNKLNVHWYTIHPENYENKFEKILHDLAGMLEKS